jgi:trehalose/maltose hydrolase-like predicted phosphorylase
VGASLAAAGPFFEADVNQTNASTPVTNGWPMFDPRISFSTISGFYDVQPNATGVNYPWLNQYGWDSFISGIPHPTDLIFAFNNTYLDATVSNTTISNFVSSVSFKTGVGSWSYTWSPAGLSAQFNVTFTAIFSRVRPNVIAVQATIMSSEDVSGTATDLLDGRSAVRTTLAGKGLDQGNASIYSAVHPNNLPNITGWVVSTADFDQTYTNLSSRAMANGTFVSSDNSTIGQTYTINLKAGQMATFTKYVGVASTDKFSDPETTARQASANAKQAGWSALLAEHEAAWRTLMADDVVDDYTNQTTGALPDNPFLQTVHIGSIASMFYLLMNLQPDGSGLNDNSISVGGLASESYGGQVFWDADYWMAPGLNIVVPDYSKQISNFRVKLHPQALANAAFNGYPNGSSLYSWTTGKYGNCTGTGPCVDYEYHLNYDICFNLLQELNVTQNWTWFGNGPRQIIESTAMMTGQLLMYNSTTQNYWLHNATDPDEYANNVDNPAFTIASASQLLGLANNLREHYGLPRNQTWDTIASDIDFPRAPSNITLEYETMNASVVVKQADVVLMTYPLDYMASNYTAAERVLDLDYVSLFSPFRFLPTSRPPFPPSPQGNIMQFVRMLNARITVLEPPIARRPRNDLLHLRDRRLGPLDVGVRGLDLHAQRLRALPPRAVVPVLGAGHRRPLSERRHGAGVPVPDGAWRGPAGRSFRIPGLAHGSGGTVGESESAAADPVREGAALLLRRRPILRPYQLDAHHADAVLDGESDVRDGCIRQF